MFLTLRHLIYEGTWVIQTYLGGFYRLLIECYRPGKQVRAIPFEVRFGPYIFRDARIFKVPIIPVEGLILSFLMFIRYCLYVNIRGLIARKRISHILVPMNLRMLNSLLKFRKCLSHLRLFLIYGGTE